MATVFQEKCGLWCWPPRYYNSIESGSENLLEYLTMFHVEIYVDAFKRLLLQLHHCLRIKQFVLFF